MFNLASLYRKTAIVFMIGLSVSLSFGQQTGGTLRGQVADQQTAVIVGATVEAIDADGKVKTVVTNDQGEYVLSGLAPGKYTVRAYNTAATEHNLQLTETAVISKSIINETRFQFLSRGRENSGGDITTPTIQVFDAYTSGGANVGNSSNNEKRWELSNNTSWTFSNHSLKAGVRLRGISIDNVSNNNFAGTYSFTSLDQYRSVLLGVSGATPTQFTIAAGNSF